MSDVPPEPMGMLFNTGVTTPRSTLNPMHETDRERTSMTRRQLLASSLGAAALATADTTLAQPEIPTASRELWQWVRTQPMLDGRIAWLNTASVGPTLRLSMASEYRARESQASELASFAGTDRWSFETTRLATRFAAFAGCDPHEVLFTHGAGEALSTVAGGLDLTSGDEVVTTTQEHPAALSPWLFQARRRGIVVKQVPLPAVLTGPEQALSLLAGALTERTRVLAFSHVQYADGAVLPVRELCQLARQRNIVSVVDGAQAFGMLDFNLRDLGCDYYALCFHKWLLGSHGTGMLYVRREMLDRLWPLTPQGIDAYPPVATPTQSAGQADVPAALHRLGNVVPQLWPSLKGSEAALDFHQQIRRGRIEARVRELSLYARLRLQQIAGIQLPTPTLPGLWGGILTFRLPGRSAKDVATTLARVNRVYVSNLSWPDTGEGALRLSLHMFNTHDEIDLLMRGLETATR